VQKITDEEAYEGVRMLAKNEGILAGISSGACLIACLKLANEVQNSLIVTLFADDLSRYFSRNLID
jgi:cysteine synthase A